ncbi:hypothetical protein [Lacticaseibacillus sharpeae]|uniref:Uncharacterized protein n=1 Tax=Lacticaseibacillus sharpeae JCM 1186 = DSM 20505 TaxID=1291052 RepID=A0A0R1ZS51_9LACO|nr:hypothetical protein [Lacticaseibacillus sharpeae]KRM54827.1 hypothetical protein FC18_GL002244 [Lacticaseibacillus sharpeae JCM 1186 = DSM 20505]
MTYEITSNDATFDGSHRVTLKGTGDAGQSLIYTQKLTDTDIDGKTWGSVTGDELVTIMTARLAKAIAGTEA